MRTKIEIKKRLDKLKADERLSYPPALVDINAPLALIQVELTAQVAMLRWVLDEKGEKD